MVRAPLCVGRRIPGVDARAVQHELLTLVTAAIGRMLAVTVTKRRVVDTRRELDMTASRVIAQLVACGVSSSRAVTRGAAFA